MRGFGFTYQRNGHWWIRYYHKGDHRESVSLSQEYARLTRPITEADAKRLLKKRFEAKMVGRIGSPDEARCTVAKVLDVYLASLEARNVKSLPNVKRQVSSLQGWMGPVRAVAVTEAYLLGWVRKMLNEEYAAASVQTYLWVLHAAFTVAHRLQVVPKMPFFPRVQGVKVRQGFWEREEFDRFAQELPEWLADLAKFGYLTGWRVSECIGLTWDRVDFKNDTLRLDETKTGPRIRPILLPELTALLKKRMRDRAVGCPFVFHRDGLVIGISFRRIWNATLERMKMPAYKFHDFRRTAYRELVQKGGVDLFTAMELTGHKSLSVAKRYNIVDLGRQRAGLEKYLAAVEVSANKLEQPGLR